MVAAVSRTTARVGALSAHPPYAANPLLARPSSVVANSDHWFRLVSNWPQINVRCAPCDPSRSDSCPDSPHSSAIAACGRPRWWESFGRQISHVHMPIERLPFDVVHIVLSYLPAADLPAVALVCHLFCAVATPRIFAHVRYTPWLAKQYTKVCAHHPHFRCGLTPTDRVSVGAVCRSPRASRPSQVSRSV